ncbi:acyl-[acyl-carrier protein] desaturase [Mycolicibacterium fortuitum subsp. acetamidolyticum]|uniref:Acyl-[acyl-carrier protein] desaturase n=1 Tax=Mycolicibacterium fortuitum subsp. acetamidolyticum TaxID=144550 RepID=A0A124E3Z3_MYCFO|nr:acyl-[acyl-carrier protein] desaturase [Mycolicibacterium fortuitum subsp. acetamidolyticum]
MQLELTDAVLQAELEQIAEVNLNRHLATTKDWYPHDYIPWESGSNLPPPGAATGTPSSRN